MTAIDPQPGTRGAGQRLDGMRCCILGVTGFLGKNLARALCDSGAVVCGLARGRLDAPGLDPRVRTTVGEFGCESTLAEAVRGQDAVYHLASSSLPATSNRDPAGDLADNVVATVRLLDVCRRQGVRQVVFASSGGTVYGIPRSVPIPETASTDPITAYGIAKLAIEKYLHLYQHLFGLDYRILRISNPYGPHQPFEAGQGLVATAIHRLIRRRPIEVWGDGSVVRDYIHVDDVATAFIAATTYSGPHKIMNVGSGIGRSVNEVIADVAEAIPEAGLPEIIYYPARLVDVPTNVLDIGLIINETGWRPTIEWQHGLRETVRWIRSL